MAWTHNKDAPSTTNTYLCFSSTNSKIKHNRQMDGRLKKNNPKNGQTFKREDQANKNIWDIKFTF